MTETIHDWLSKLSNEDGICIRSAERSYATDENDYDRQYAVDPRDTRLGRWILREMQQRGLRERAIGLEIACGTGRLTVGLADSPQISRLIVSDASTAFLKITRSKVATFKGCTPIDYLRLADIDFNELPNGSLDIVFLRAALHHFDNFSTIAQQLIRKLAPGGFLAMFEPRAEFFVYSVFLLRLAIERVNSRGSADGKNIIDLATQFKDGALFYTSRDRKPVEVEDRYAFFLEEFVDIARESDTILHICGGEDCGKFSDSFLGHMRYCMDSTDSLISSLASILEHELTLANELFRSRPRFSAAEWYLFQKRREPQGQQRSSFLSHFLKIVRT